jgi:Pentapeptide repeats (8 copies)
MVHKKKTLVRQPDPPSKWPRWTGFRGKTVWDWLPVVGALLIPVVIALGTGWITWRLAMIENQRAEAERELAEQRAQDEALQVYLNQMSTLLLEKDLRASTEVNATEESQEARALARARTLTGLSRLDPSRKTALMQFLVEADLVQRVAGKEPIISLRGADLSDADLERADLSGAILSGTNLTEAALSYANLSRADLTGAANLSAADLSGADLSDAQGWTEEQLSAAGSLEGATMPDGQTLRSAYNRNGPTFEDWLKSKD